MMDERVSECLFSANAFLTYHYSLVVAFFKSVFGGNKSRSMKNPSHITVASRSTTNLSHVTVARRIRKEFDVCNKDINCPVSEKGFTSGAGYIKHFKNEHK